MFWLCVVLCTKAFTQRTLQLKIFVRAINHAWFVSTQYRGKFSRCEIVSCAANRLLCAQILLQIMLELVCWSFPFDWWHNHGWDCIFKKWCACSVISFQSIITLGYNLKISSRQRCHSILNASWCEVSKKILLSLVNSRTHSFIASLQITTKNDCRCPTWWDIIQFIAHLHGHKVFSNMS